MTADALNRAGWTAVIVPLSTGPAARTPIVVATPWGMAKFRRCCDQLRAVDKRRLLHSSGRLSAADLRVIEEGVRRCWSSKLVAAGDEVVANPVA